MSEDVIRLSANADNVYRAMADAFVTYSNEVIQKTGACVVGITGGSVVEGLMAVLVNPLYNQKVNWEDTYFLWTDERFVDYDDPDSYYGRIARLVDGAVSVKDGKVWDRVSMTFSFLAKASTVWFGVVGERKRAALRKVLYQRRDFEGFSWDERLQEVLPGAVLCQDDILWFVDQEAYEGAALRQG